MAQNRNGTIGQGKRGQIMLIIILAIVGIFITGTAISLTIIKELRRLGSILDSVKAFYAADAGVEWQFYAFLRSSSVPPPELTNNTLCCRQEDIKITAPEVPGQSAKLKSIGSSPAFGRAYRIKRSIETNTSW